MSSETSGRPWPTLRMIRSTPAHSFSKTAGKIAIALVDSCYVKREEMDRAKALASKRTGIPVNAYPDFGDARALGSALASHCRNALEERYVERLVTQIAEAITQANGRLRPAQIGWAVVPVPDELFNRRWFMREGGIVPSPFGETTDKARMNPLQVRKTWCIRPAA